MVVWTDHWHGQKRWEYFCISEPGATFARLRCATGYAGTQTISQVMDSACMYNLETLLFKGMAQSKWHVHHHPLHRACLHLSVGLVGK